MYAFTVGVGGGADLHRGRGGARGRNRNDLFFHHIYIEHNQKSNWGGGGAWCEWGRHAPSPPPPIVTPLRIYSWIFLRCYVVRV